MLVEGKVIAGRGAPLSFPIPSAASKASFTHPFYLLSSLGERINLPQVPSPPPIPRDPASRRDKFPTRRARSRDSGRSLLAARAAPKGANSIRQRNLSSEILIKSNFRVLIPRLSAPLGS